MTKQELADLLGVSRPTLNTWEKEKPELVKLINQGLFLDEHIRMTEQYLKDLKELKKEVNQNKFKLKSK